MSEKFSEKEITESFDKALKNGEVTDVMGNPIELGEVTEIVSISSSSIMGNPIELEEVEVGNSGDFNSISFDQALRVLKSTQGKVLTIIDATFVDEKRLKYVKDLIKEIFSTQGDWLFTVATEGVEPLEIVD